MQGTKKQGDAMVNISINAAKNVPGERPKSNNNRYENEEIVELSGKNNKMRIEIDSTQNKKLKTKKKKE